ncbi:hypothetical protein THRCLA_04410 [Thraustotheca clavata]|uniref:Pentacotripeptide-repeat region of PRORP domain-containing protein n=1 Tax=Thraustotheca clavata TaxID=74557 RepID=A0A1V9ZZ58_9STRA|nr:hypothetical protein THRCLA_04410 [Thraustotheca clavata]
MQRAARQTSLRWFSNKDVVLKKSSLAKHFNENPEKAMSVFRGLDTLGMGPDATQLRSILVTLSKSNREAEVKEVLEYAMKREISINWSDFFRNGLEHSSSPLQLVEMFESAVATNPSILPTSSYITIIRQCLKVNDFERALKLYKHIENEEFRLHQLNKGVMQVLVQLSKARTEENNEIIDKATKWTLGLFIKRRTSQVPMEEYLDVVAQANPEIVTTCLRMILRKETSPIPDHRQKQMETHINDATPIFDFCNKHNIGVSYHLFTSYFLKCKHANVNPKQVVQIFLEMEKKSLTQTSAAACTAAMHSCISHRENDLALACIRVALKQDLGRNSRHYNTAFWICSKTNEKELAIELFDNMRKQDEVIPNEKTLTSILLNLNTSNEGWNLQEVLAYFAKHQVKPTSREYSQLVEILSSTPSIEYPDIDQLKPEPTIVNKSPPRRKTQEEKDLAATEAMISKPIRAKPLKPAPRYRTPREPKKAVNTTNNEKNVVEPTSWKREEREKELTKEPEPKKDSSCSIM